jgi:hypothetical protein
MSYPIRGVRTPRLKIGDKNNDEALNSIVGSLAVRRSGQRTTNFSRRAGGTKWTGRANSSNAIALYRPIDPGHSLRPATFASQCSSRFSSRERDDARRLHSERAELEPFGQARTAHIRARDARGCGSAVPDFGQGLDLASKFHQTDAESQLIDCTLEAREDAAAFMDASHHFSKEAWVMTNDSSLH